jgi:WD40 repeat protein
MARVFISHSSRNSDKAIEVRDWLAANGWDDVFLDLDPERGIVAGQRWKEALQKAAYRCELVVALVSQEWLSSNWCKSEVDAARLMGKKVIVALVGVDKSQVPPDLTDEQFIDLTGDPNAYRRLREGLKRGGLDPTSFPFEPGRRPYPGFAYLEEQDAAVFFGRDAQIVRGLDEVRRVVRTGVARMLVILGASGAGKSSFLRAGLWSRLRRDERAWLPLPVMRPERAAISGKYGLAQALQQIVSEPRFVDNIRKRGLPRSRADIQDFIETNDDGLARLFAALRDIAQSESSSDNPVPPTIVFALDQGEELFNEEGRDEARRFIEILTRTLIADPRTLAILVMRSDSFPLLQSEPDLAALPKDTFTLDMMLQGSYRKVIEDPSRLVEPPLRIDPLLTDALLQDISGQDALPLLAFTLAHLYENYAADHELTLAGYDRIGRVAGVIDRTVAEAFSAGVASGEAPKDKEAQLALARSAFIPHLAQVNAAGQFVRRVATLDQIPAEARPLIGRFAEQRLLIKDSRKGTEVVEVAHEALLRQPPFSDWLAADREFLVWRGRLSEAREAYNADQRGLLAGRELAIARDYLEKRTEREIEPADRAFIAESIAEEDRRVHADEANKREVQEQRIRDAEQIAAEQKKAAAAGKRTARIAVAGAVVALAIAAVAAFEYFNATQATKLATVRQWAAQARIEAGTPHGLLVGLNSISLAEKINAANLIDSIQLLTDLLSWAGGLPLRHAQPVAAVKFSYDGRWLASASGGEILLRNPQAPADKPLTLKSNGDVTKIVFSPDGRLLAAAGQDVQIYDTNAADPAAGARVLPGHNKPIRDIALSVDGRWLATASADSTVRLWDMAAADPAATKLVLRHDPGKPVNSVAFSPDGHWLAAGETSRISLWDLQNLSTPPKAVHEDPDVDIIKVAFSTDAKWLVAGATETYHVLLFQAPFDKPPLPLKVNQWVGSVAFSPDKRWLVVPDHYDAMVLDLNKADPTSEPIVLRGHKDAIADMAFSPDGVWFVTASQDRSAQRWNVSDRFSGPTVLKGHEGPISSLSFSGDSQWLATASTDTTARLWNVSSPLGQPTWLHSQLDPTKLRLWDMRAAQHPAVSQILGDELGITAGRVFSPNGKWLATLTASGDDINLVNLATSPPAEHVLQHETGAAPVFSPDGRWLATGGWSDQTIRLWDLNSPEPEKNPIELSGHGGPIRSLAFSADSRRLISGANDTLALVWDLAAPNPSANPKTLPGGGGSSIIRTVAISPDGRYGLTGSWEPDYAARVWDLSLPDPASKPIKLSFTNRVFESAFSLDGRWAAAISWDRTAQLLDLAKPGAKPFVLRGHSGRNLSLAFSPDNRWLATGNEDRTVRLWSLTADDPSADSVALSATVGVGVSFSPDRRRLALIQTEYRSNPFNPDGSLFASTDADTHFYDVGLEDLKALACRIAGRNLTAEEAVSSRRSPFPLGTEVCPP